MKRLAVSATILLSIGCAASETSTDSGTADDGRPTYTVSVQGRQGWTTYHVVVIDGCEYLWSGPGNAGQFTHKGNCKSCRSAGVTGAKP